MAKMYDVATEFKDGTTSDMQYLTEQDLYAVIPTLEHLDFKVCTIKPHQERVPVQQHA